MARGRLVSRTLGSSRKFADLHRHAGKLREFCQVLYPLIIANTDDFGRMAGDAFTVKHAVFPTSPRREDEFSAALVAMHHAQLIQIYTDDQGQAIIQVRQFDSHQPGLSKRTKSRFSEPPVNFTEVPEILSEFKGTELKRREGNRREIDQNKPALKPRRASRPVENRNAADEPSPDRDAPALRDCEGGPPGRYDDRRLRVEGADEAPVVEAGLRLSEPGPDGPSTRAGRAGDAEGDRAAAGEAAGASGAAPASTARSAVAGPEAGGVGSGRPDAGRRVSGWSKLGDIKAVAS